MDKLLVFTDLHINDDTIIGLDPVVLFTHHPLGSIGFPMMDRIKLTNAANVIDSLKAHSSPVYVLAGHVHRTISGQ